MRTSSILVRAIVFLVALGLVASVAAAFAESDKQDQEKKTEEVVTEKAAEAKPVHKKVYVIQIKDHKFIPAQLVVPAGKKIKLRIENLDKTAEEFESYDLNREKIVAGTRKITVYVGPLKPGIYKYFGEFHPKTAQGTIVAK